MCLQFLVSPVFIRLNLIFGAQLNESERRVYFYFRKVVAKHCYFASSLPLYGG